jgi:hypothetical protein
MYQFVYLIHLITTVYIYFEKKVPSTLSPDKRCKSVTRSKLMNICSITVVVVAVVDVVVIIFAETTGRYH